MPRFERGALLERFRAMAARREPIIGGTGQISLPCVEQSVAAGHKVSVFNRAQRGEALPAGVESIVGDMKDEASYAQLGTRSFDVVCQFMAFLPEQVARDIALFRGRALEVGLVEPRQGVAHVRRVVDR